MSPSTTSFPSSSSAANGSVNDSDSNCVRITGKNYIEHQVSKFDTLAGVAIKYGVEVADIKKINGLATDLQMFALKTLQIPLPGRHPPSPCLSNGSQSHRQSNAKKSSSRVNQSNGSEPFQSLRLTAPQKEVSSAMSTLQKYYGLRSPNQKGAAEGTEMKVYKSVSLGCLNDELLPRGSPLTDSPEQRNSKNYANGFMPDNYSATNFVTLAETGDGEGEKSDEKSVRRRQKAEVDMGAGTPEKTLTGENSGGRNGSSGSTGKGLAMRQKAANRSGMQSDSESGWLTSIPVGMGDSILADGMIGVRKSSSTSSLKEQENSNSVSIWPTSRWNLKPDLQALSTAALTRPIFDGLPKPITGRKKAALD